MTHDLLDTPFTTKGGKHKGLPDPWETSSPWIGHVARHVACGCTRTNECSKCEYW